MRLSYDLVLIQPPSTQLDDPRMYFPLAVPYLAAAVEEAGFSVWVADCREEVVPLPEARFYGFSCCTPHIGIAKQIAKQYDVRAQTIIGGPHATVVPEDCDKDFDFVVMGEGERVLVEILEGKHQPGRVVAPRILDLDTLPLPAWHRIPRCVSTRLFPGQRYGKGPPAITMILSRGCPFACSYCANTMRAPVVFRSPDNIERELAYWATRGVYHFRFEDDTFTINPALEEVCRMLERRKIVWKGHTRSDQASPDKLRLLQASGCEELGLGVESADDDVLMINRKRETRDVHLLAVHNIKKAGMRAKTYFVQGLPGETLMTLELNKRFMREAKPHKWTLSRFTPYPGCEVWRDPAAYGVKILDRDFTHYWNFPDRSVCELDTADQAELERRYKELYAFMLSEVWR